MLVQYWRPWLVDILISLLKLKLKPDSEWRVEIWQVQSANGRHPVSPKTWIVRIHQAQAKTLTRYFNTFIIGEGAVAGRILIYRCWILQRRSVR